MAEINIQVGARNDEPVEFDELGRGPHLMAALKTIVTLDAPLVLGVYGDWGQGKTSFMRTLQSLLSKDSRAEYDKAEAELKLPKKDRMATRTAQILKDSGLNTDDVLSVWFNPWQYQFENDPIFPLLDAIRIQQASRWEKLNDRFKRIVEDPTFRIIGKAALGVSQLVGPGWFNVLTRQIGDEAREVMKQFGSFRSEFEQCMKKLTEDTGHRMVIFVDDLDRCEAEHTVRILEALKLHLLNPHCVFVLGCADERVRAALRKKLRLSDSEARDYLEKIVQIPVRLPRPRDDDLARLLRRLGWERFADDKTAFALIRAFAGRHANPRRLKRFLHWYELERAMVEFVPGLAESAASNVLNPETVFLKVKMLQYLHPDRFVTVEDFAKGDVGAQHERKEEEKTQ